MFRCQLTGQVSDPAVYELRTVTNEVTGETYKAHILVKAAEKPLRVVVDMREKSYTNRYKNEDGDVEVVVTKGTEIVKEIMIREKNLDLLKGRGYAR